MKICGGVVRPIEEGRSKDVVFSPFCLANDNEEEPV